MLAHKKRPQNNAQYYYNVAENVTALHFLNICFIQDVQKQRTEIERLQALLTQHNIPFDSNKSK